MVKGWVPFVGAGVLAVTLIIVSVMMDREVKNGSVGTKLTLEGVKELAENPDESMIEVPLAGAKIYRSCNVSNTTGHSAKCKQSGRREASLDRAA